MPKDIAVLVIHGMGKIKNTYGKTMSNKLEKKLKKKLSKELGESTWKRVHYEAIYYSNILQDRQDAMFEMMRESIPKPLFFPRSICNFIFAPSKNEKSIKVTFKKLVKALCIGAAIIYALAAIHLPIMFVWPSLNIKVWLILGVNIWPFLAMLITMIVIILLLMLNPFFYIITLLLREFMMYSLSDAAVLSTRVHNKEGQEKSTYMEVNEQIEKTSVSTFKAFNKENKPVIIVAHSLGAHLISNYIWDKQNILKNMDDSNIDELSVEEHFTYLHTLKSFITMGCNIPLLISGHKNIKSISKSDCGYDFEWYNYYDKDDILGWPLQGIDTTYNKATKDIVINAWGSIPGFLLKSWNPLCHYLEYWRDDDIIEKVAVEIISRLEEHDKDQQ